MSCPTPVPTATLYTTVYSTTTVTESGGGGGAGSSTPSSSSSTSSSSSPSSSSTPSPGSGVGSSSGSGSSVEATSSKRNEAGSGGSRSMAENGRRWIKFGKPLPDLVPAKARDEPAPGASYHFARVVHSGARGADGAQQHLQALASAANAIYPELLVARQQARTFISTITRSYATATLYSTPACNTPASSHQQQQPSSFQQSQQQSSQEQPVASSEPLFPLTLPATTGSETTRTAPIVTYLTSTYYATPTSSSGTAKASNVGGLANGDGSGDGSGSVNAGAIAGGVVGGIAGAAGLLFLFFWLCRRNKQRQQLQQAHDGGLPSKEGSLADGGSGSKAFLGGVGGLFARKHQRLDSYFDPTGVRGAHGGGGYGDQSFEYFGTSGGARTSTSEIGRAFTAGGAAGAEADADDADLLHDPRRESWGMLGVNVKHAGRLGAESPIARHLSQSYSHASANSAVYASFADTSTTATAGSVEWPSTVSPKHEKQYAGITAQDVNAYYAVGAAAHVKQQQQLLLPQHPAAGPNHHEPLDFDQQVAMVAFPPPETRAQLSKMLPTSPNFYGFAPSPARALSPSRVGADSADRGQRHSATPTSHSEAKEEIGLAMTSDDAVSAASASEACSEASHEGARSRLSGAISSFSGLRHGNSVRTNGPGQQLAQAPAAAAVAPPTHNRARSDNSLLDAAMSLSRQESLAFPPGTEAAQSAVVEKADATAPYADTVPNASPSVYCALNSPDSQPPAGPSSPTGSSVRSLSYTKSSQQQHAAHVQAQHQHQHRLSGGNWSVSRSRPITPPFTPGLYENYPSMYTHLDAQEDGSNAAPGGGAGEQMMGVARSASGSFFATSTSGITMPTLSSASSSSVPSEADFSTQHQAQLQGNNHQLLGSIFGEHQRQLSRGSSNEQHMWMQPPRSGNTMQQQQMSAPPMGPLPSLPSNGSILDPHGVAIGPPRTTAALVTAASMHKTPAFARALGRDVHSGAAEFVAVVPASEVDRDAEETERLGANFWRASGVLHIVNSGA
ncbi:hypothetical protein K437DRAFT_77750 [Tilletiaria anomala UBC 951]|uniref:Uncharacterized protein n=1 Tax=Tilletiaria anomala (strain ATCC 24038 / CBS 436.72 / UBC 951) TaxID=1037660 RepID=A0A066V5I4_TILAU|nr:uncharacterized protein K437DRAFT_77750 [Tilletiaria anomala UBC 951]KDN35508.1 hypothetical protein K437DRAFT_77750 [Tilletiaria anomala UBC 951]